MVLSKSALLIRVSLGLPDQAFIFGCHSNQSQTRLALRAADKRATFLLQFLWSVKGAKRTLRALFDQAFSCPSLSPTGLANGLGPRSVLCEALLHDPPRGSA